MAVQIRSKRKKNFGSNEGMRIDDPAGRGVENDDAYETNLNVRRSSRKPKPKKLSDDFQEEIPIEIKIKQEPLDDDEDSLNTPTVYMSETPVFDSGEESIVNLSGARRETRKSFQTYLETLGYNTDFSKITASEQHSETWPRSGKTSRLGKKAMVTFKTEQHENVAQSWPLSDIQSEQTHTPPKVRASSRTPKPKKTFMLLEEEKKQSNSMSDLGSVESHLNVETKASKKSQNIKSPCGNEKNKTPERRCSKPVSTSQPSSTPLGMSEVNEPSDIMSDETDGSAPSRISARVRVPKRRFSLLEVESQGDAKLQKMSNSPEIKKEKQKENFRSTSSKNKLAGHSSVVVKRSKKKKQVQVKKQKEQSESTLDSCPGKVKKIIEDIHIKREVDTAESSQSETEKKTVVKKGRERIEKIVETLKLAKQSDLVVSSQREKPEEKTSSLKKGVKRKRESNNEVTKKNAKASRGKKAKKDNDQSEHIVLKLCIPHGKKKQKTKKIDEKLHHKHHHHHHKHKKTKESSTVLKRGKSKSTATIKNRKKVKTNEPGKKTVKKKKMNIKQEKTDNESHPHVKLIIKKSPSKAEKIAEVMMEDVSGESSEIATEAEQGGKETSGNKPDMKKKLPTKKYKSLTVKPFVPARPLKKKKDKTMKSRTVSAYSLFTKNRRKGLLEKEPELDFATTSRRLAEMWKNLPSADQEYWKAKARAVRMPNGKDPTRSFLRSRRGVYDSYNWSHFSDVPPSSTGTEAIDMAAYLKLLGESLCSIGMCLKRQDQMEVHGSLSVLLDTALCSIVPIFCLTSQLPEMAGCSPETQAQMLDNLAYIIPGL